MASQVALKMAYRTPGNVHNTHAHELTWGRKPLQLHGKSTWTQVASHETQENLNYNNGFCCLEMKKAREMPLGSVLKF